MKYWQLLLCGLLCVFSAGVQSQSLDDASRVSLITCGPGSDLYATFGHSAVQVYDARLGIDRVYNYGTFDFDTPNFYLKFAQGKLNYALSVTSFERFLRTYQYEGRWVYRQDLNLTEEEKNELFAFLENNALPENKDYKYDFFYDNCSTRIRDAMEQVLGEKLKYPDFNQDTTATFRQLIDLYLLNHPWSDIGIDLALGIPCDKRADFREKMFLPDYLKDRMGSATISDSTGKARGIVLAEGFVLEETRQGANDSESVTWIFWVLFFICAVTSVLGNPEKMRWFDIVFFTICGLLGIAVFLLWFATDHSATKWNMNNLWALPSWLYGAWLLLKKKPAGTFFKVHAIILFFVVLAWPWIPQSLSASMIPVVLALIARSWSWQKRKFVAQTS
jgi:hypothetical protein